MRRLLIRPGAIGDCILAIPAMEHLTAEYTEVWISSPLVPLIQFADVVRPISLTGLELVGVGEFGTPDRLLRALNGFDSIVTWYGTGRPEFREALKDVSVPCEFLPALPPPHFAGHVTDFFAQQVGAPPGSTPRVAVKNSKSRDKVAIHPFSGSRRKNWPLEFYRELSSLLRVEVEWTAGPEEELPGAVRFEGLDELGSWLTGASLYIGNDSGVTHLAAAAGVSVLALFGPTQPETWAPRGSNVTVLRRDPIDVLRVESVLAAATGLLGGKVG